MIISIAIAGTPEDFDDFSALADEYEASLPPDLRHASWSDERSRVAAAFGPPNEAFLATCDARPVGCVALIRQDANAGIIKKLYVRPDGRGTGAGRALVQAVIHEARRLGFNRLLLDTDRERLEPAYRLYLSLGFEECEPFAAVDYLCPTFMELRLP